MYRIRERIVKFIVRGGDTKKPKIKEDEEIEEKVILRYIGVGR